MNKITIIGAGAVGRSIAVTLKKRRVPISGIYSAVGRSAKRVAAQSAVKNSGKFSADVPLSEFVIIAVPDSAIQETAAMIAAGAKTLRGITIVHTSGALTSDELAAVKKKGAAVGSFHPLQTFPKKKVVTDLDENWWAIEGDSRAAALCIALAKKMRSKYFRIAKKDKPLYHIAAVFASNYQVTLLSVVEQLAGYIRIPKQDLWKIFRPLMVKTMENVLASSPAEALTGPIARGDYRTIMNHIAVLESSKKLDHLIPLYSALGVETAKLAKKKF